MKGEERITMIMKIMMVIKMIMSMTIMMKKKATHPHHHHRCDCHHWLLNDILGEETR